MRKDDPQDPLDRLLDEWRDVPPPSAHLQAEIWQRIATHQATRNHGWRLTLIEWFEHPAAAIGFVAACAMAGLLFAEVHVSHLQRRRSAELARSYLLLIDPLLNVPVNERRP